MMNPFTFLALVTWLAIASLIYVKALATIQYANRVRGFTMLLSLAWPVVLVIVLCQMVIGSDTRHEGGPDA